MADAVKKPSSVIQRRKRVRRRVVRSLGFDPSLRWIHGVLYGSDGREYARESTGSLGTDGLAKPQERHAQHVPPRQKERPWWER